MFILAWLLQTMINHSTAYRAGCEGATGDETLDNTLNSLQSTPSGEKQQWQPGLVLV